MRMFLLLIAIVVIPSGALAIDAVTPELKESILERCRDQMKDYGASLVKACADQDLAAAKALITNSNDESTREIVTRCERTMSSHGWSLVKACVDQDLEAKKALGEIEKEHGEIVASCTKRMKSHGWNLVKACVDQDVEAEEALKKF